LTTELGVTSHDAIPNNHPFRITLDLSVDWWIFFKLSCKVSPSYPKKDMMQPNLKSDCFFGHAGTETGFCSRIWHLSIANSGTQGKEFINLAQ